MSDTNSAEDTVKKIADLVDNLSKLSKKRWTTVLAAVAVVFFATVSFCIVLYAKIQDIPSKSDILQFSRDVATLHTVQALKKELDETQSTLIATKKVLSEYRDGYQPRKFIAEPQLNFKIPVNDITLIRRSRPAGKLLEPLDSQQSGYHNCIVYAHGHGSKLLTIYENTVANGDTDHYVVFQESTPNIVLRSNTDASVDYHLRLMEVDRSGDVWKCTFELSRRHYQEP